MPADPASRYKARDRALLTELGDGTAVLLDLDSKFYFTLNETAIYVWRLLSEAPLSREELSERVAKEFEVDVARASADLEPVLELLYRERLLHVAA